MRRVRIIPLGFAVSPFIRGTVHARSIPFFPPDCRKARGIFMKANTEKQSMNNCLIPLKKGSILHSNVVYMIKVCQKIHITG